MRRPQPTILGLMGVVAVVALGAVALRESDEMWASCLFSLTLCVLGLACLGAAFQRGASRAFFAGFAAVGIAYLGLWGTEAVGPHLVTTKLIRYVEPRLLRGVPNGERDRLEAWIKTQVNPSPDVGLADVDADGRTEVIVAGMVFRNSGQTPASFERIGHSLFALAFGVVGGIAARYFRDSEGSA